MNKCKDCTHWYHSSQADQCNIPNPGFISNENFNKAVGLNEIQIDETKMNFIKERDGFYKKFKNITNPGMKTIYGHPSELNFDNTCIFFKKIPWYSKWMFRARLRGGE